ncbi:MAG: hypothetical protein WD250_09990 [Egibacteraceae bacterium]
MAGRGRPADHQLTADDLGVQPEAVEHPGGVERAQLGVGHAVAGDVAIGVLLSG